MAEDRVRVLILDKDNVVQADSYLERGDVDFTSITYTSQISGWGSFSGAVLYAQSPYVDFLEPDYRIVVLRQIEGSGSWITDFVGLIRRIEFFTPETGIDLVQIWGREIDSVINRYDIEPPIGYGYSTKSGFADNVVKEYVRDQVVDDLSKAFPNLVVAVDKSESLYTGEWNARYNKLANYIRGIRDTANDFDYKITLSDDYSLFTFDTYSPQFGRDLRADNPEGNSPMLFSIDNGNMTMPRYWKVGFDGATEVIVLGQGYLENRSVVKITDDDLADEWGFTQIVRDARHTDDTDELTALGQALLEEKKPKERISFEALETDAYRYYRDWRLGDRVTGRYLNVEADFMIEEVRIVVRSDALEDKKPILRQISDVRTI